MNCDDLSRSITKALTGEHCTSNMFIEGGVKDEL